MKKIISSILSVLMVISAFSVLGTTALADENAKEIWNIDDLYNIRKDMNADYILMTDIDMTEYVANDGDYCYLCTNGWNPIGSNGKYSNTAFMGTFDGNNHTIKGLRLETATIPSGTSDRYLGLFANNSGTIKNLSLDDVSIKCVEETSSYKNIGTICGYNNGTVENCHVLGGYIDANSYYINSDKISTYTHVGGIAGRNENRGIINKCSNNATISGSVYNDSGQYSFIYMGGIIGLNNGNIMQSYNSGNLKEYAKNYSGCLYEGGIVGTSYPIYSSITNCYNSGKVYNTTGYDVKEHICGIGEGC